jgi:hypothetical protein
VHVRSSSVIEELPDLSNMHDCHITEIDVSNCPRLRELPYDQLLSIASLRSVNCRACPKLVWPPEEVRSDMGEKVMHFLRERHWDVREKIQRDKIPDIDVDLLNRCSSIYVVVCLCSPCRWHLQYPGHASVHVLQAWCISMLIHVCGISDLSWSSAFIIVCTETDVFRFMPQY